MIARAFLFIFTAVKLGSNVGEERPQSDRPLCRSDWRRVVSGGIDELQFDPHPREGAPNERAAQAVIWLN